MIHEEMYRRIAEEFPHAMTPQQTEAAMSLAAFVALPRPRAAFVLRGYAGTGKTSLVGALVRALQKM